jgi:hypothetical protein
MTNNSMPSWRYSQVVTFHERGHRCLWHDLRIARESEIYLKSLSLAFYLAMLLPMIDLSGFHTTVANLSGFGRAASMRIAFHSGSNQSAT